MILRRRVIVSAGGGEVDYSKQYLTIVSLADNNTIGWRCDSTTTSDSKYISYSTDGGVTWSNAKLNSTAVTLATLNTGEKLMLKYYNTSVYGASSFTSTQDFNLEGNIMSLTTSGDFTTASSVENSAFSGLFKGCDKLRSAKNLVMPATQLADWCYSAMFYDCASLTEIPELPATIVKYCCYQSMFQNTGITSLPDNYLPAMKLAYRCYMSMFEGTPLTTVPANLLPATTLAEGCYIRMFYNCKSLTSTPELRATTLVSQCYSFMFEGCDSLNRVTCLATGELNGYTNEWLPENLLGNFIKNHDTEVNAYLVGNSGIPANMAVNEHLPDRGYDEEATYLESSGTQYISLGIKPHANEICEVKFKYVTNSASMVMGCRTSSSAGKFSVGSGSSGTTLFAALGSHSNVTLARGDLNEHTVVLNTGTGKASIDGGAEKSIGTFSDNNLGIYIFANNQNLTVGLQAKVRIMSVKIGTRMELIPVRVGLKGYMYDKKGGLLYCNKGTGDFDFDKKVTGGVYAYYSDGTMKTYDDADTNAIGVAVILDNYSCVIDKYNANNGNACDFGANNVDLITAGADHVMVFGNGGTLNGAASTTAIINASSDTPAARAARAAFGGAGYLPTAGEWEAVFGNELYSATVNAMLTKIGGTVIDYSKYWTSSVNDGRFDVDDPVNDGKGQIFTGDYEGLNAPTDRFSTEFVRAFRTL